MDIEAVRRSLDFIKNVEIKDIASLKDSAITKTLNDIYFNDFDNIEEALNELEKIETISKLKPEVLKRFKIELQPMKRKQNIHYSNQIINYLNQNMKCWAHWNRLPITITDTTTNKQLTIHANEWIKWKEMVYEWLGIPKEVLEVI